MLSRRALLQSAAGTALLISTNKANSFFPRGVLGTQFAIGALGGGGFVCGIQFSNDGQTAVCSPDVAGAWVLRGGLSGKWVNIMTHSGVPAAYNTNVPIGAYAIAVAPTDKNRIYVFATPTGGCISTLWKSTDQGVSFIDTGLTTGRNNNALNQRFWGDKLVVDPNNSNVLYWGDASGMIYRSIDGGATIHDSGSFITSLATALPHANLNANSVQGATVLNFAAVPASVQGLNTASYNLSPCVYDGTKPSAVGLSANDPGISGSAGAFGITATTITLGIPLAAQANSGDTIYFGCGPSIAFDPSSGTTLLGGVTVTKGIYIGWAFGPGAIYQSTDGGTTFAAMTGASVPASARRMACSFDGVLYVTSNDATGNNQLTAHNFWRYVTPTSTNTGGLAVNTWTNFTSLSTPSGNGYFSPAPHPSTHGVVNAADDAGDINYSSDYGQTWAATGGGRPCYPVTAGSDAVWITNVNTGSLGGGKIAYDPSGNLWNASGIGLCYTTNPVVTSSIGLGFVIKTLDNNELICPFVLKVPGGPLVLMAEDRQMFIINDPSIAPTIAEPLQASFIGKIDDGAGNAGNLLTVTQLLHGPIWTGGLATLAGTGIGGETLVLGQQTFSATATNCSIAGNILTVSGNTGTWTSPGIVAVNGSTQLANILAFGSGGTTGAGGNGTYKLDRSPGDRSAVTLFCGGGVGTYNTSTPSATSQLVPSSTMGTNFEGIAIVYGFQVDYAKTDPTFLVAAIGEFNSEIYTSASSGANFSWQDTYHNCPTVVQPAVQSSTHWFLAATNFTPGLTNVYTTDGGATYTAPNSYTLSAANGNTVLPIDLANGWGSFFSFRRTIQADPNNSTTYYGYNNCTCGMVAATINTAGTGYAINDTITLSEGVHNDTAIIKVTSTGVSGSVAGFSIIDMGSGQSTAVTTISQSSTSGAGSGFVANCTFKPVGGFWKSTDGGVNWVQQSNPLTPDGQPTLFLGSPSSSATLQTVTGHAGHLFYADGTTNGTYSNHLHFSSDGGVTVVNVSDASITQASIVTLGKGPSPSSYPSIFIYGKANGAATTGWYRCDDFDPLNPTTSGRWLHLADFPADLLDLPTMASGDPDKYGWLYISNQNNGYCYGRI